MKWQRTLLLIALFAAGQAGAQPTAANTAASRTPNSAEQKLNPLAPSGTKVVDTRAEWTRVGGLETRAWTTVAGWSPGKSAFPSAETHSWQLPLLSIGHAPWE